MVIDVENEVVERVSMKKKKEEYLSINKNVPASLLILSRALNITAMIKPELALQTSLSSMDDEVVTEVALQAGGMSGSKETAEIRAR